MILKIKFDKKIGQKRLVQSIIKLALDLSKIFLDWRIAVHIPRFVRGNLAHLLKLHITLKLTKTIIVIVIIGMT